MCFVAAPTQLTHHTSAFPEIDPSVDRRSYGIGNKLEGRKIRQGSLELLQVIDLDQTDSSAAIPAGDNRSVCPRS